MSDIDIGKDQQISQLVSNFERDSGKQKPPIPKWDLAVVLQMLKKPPFEPLKLATLKFVTFKTVFLVAFASGNRRSELHAVTADVRYTDNWDSVTLYPAAEFVAKTQLANDGQ